MKTFIKGIIHIINFILSTIIYFIEICLLLIISINNILSFRTINTLLNNIEVKEIIKNINENENILENIYKIANNNGISNNTIDKILEQKEIKETLAKYISSNIKYILKEENNNDISVEIIANNITNKIKETLKANENKLTEKEVKAIDKKLNEFNNKLIKYLPEMEESTKNINQNTLKFIRIIFSSKTMLILILSILFLLSIIALLKKSFYKWTINLSVTTLFASLLGFVLSIIPLFNFNSFIKGTPAYIVNILSSSIQIIGNNFFIIGIIYFIIGISLASFYISYKKKKEQ